MAIESATYISDLQPSNPAGSDPVADGDNHIRLIKQVLKNTFPQVTGPVAATKEQLSSFVPTGGIILWSGAANAVPSGWALCDGSTKAKLDGSGNLVTPNLVDKFVVGAGGTYAVGASGGSTSGSFTTTSNGQHSHTGYTAIAGVHNHTGATSATALSVEQLPPHTHGTNFTVTGLAGANAAANFVTVVANAATGGTLATGSGQGHIHGIFDDGNHAHLVTTYDAGAHTHTGTVATLPPYYALCYIIKL